MARTLMIQGTRSGAGKSLVVAALCRILSNRGCRVAPFKSQNMALNSHVTVDGGEIGRAQALQAEAAGVEPSTDMNPILLKASGDSGAQVILQGRVYATMKAKEYYAFREKAWECVRESFERLSTEYEIILIEGAGSPAEINLMDVDIANMAVAELADSPVLLVADIDRGGVFASLYGTALLLGEKRRFLEGYVINKFRGDLEILQPGLDMLHRKSGLPCLGVIPYMKDIGLPEEDGLAITSGQALMRGYREHGTIRVVVLRLPYISNFTDFDPFRFEPDVELIYSLNPSDIESADILIIPGSKNTVHDLLYLKETGLDEVMQRAYKKGIQIIGICGGYQILSSRLLDPEGVESSHREVEGIGLLDVETVFAKDKITSRVTAEFLGSSFPGEGLESEATHALEGYEIHMGRSSGDIGLFRVTRYRRSGRDGSMESVTVTDGSVKKNCWGTYLHGIFENDGFRRAVINGARIRKGLSPLGIMTSYRDKRLEKIDEVAGVVRRHLEMDHLFRILEL